MKYLITLITAPTAEMPSILLTTNETPFLEGQAQPEGVDVSSWQKTVNWGSLDISFAYIKATEGTRYTSPYFASQYNGAYDAGLIRGAYHFALPNVSSGAAQANYFLAHGGGWTNDGKTLPGALDLEYNPYGPGNYGLSAAAMVAWIHDFVNTYYAATTRYPVIFTTTDWWTACTGNNSGFSTTCPLWIARWASSPGKLPAGWRKVSSVTGYLTYTSTGPGVGDHNKFNGGMAGLGRMATG
ncbi:glycoside hydrolase family 25 protein [Tulasnella calospora MUT 4182]|uniref:N,O-diacetylmuramidase n=1 Tax=Tulasnella calospora MUT 4182 TaxID=1051891 RepID=A0A0C3PXP6_9AGAM|nr:glycoside hydrolase family 25 protein [Tulasnella calospora MUT 4182]